MVGVGAVDGNQVELVPPYTVRTGLRSSWNGATVSVLASWVGEQYSDASNTEYTSSAVTGVIPSYAVVDITVSYAWQSITVAATANNLLDSQYFTRRATSYPGPGIIPAEPRSLFLTLEWNGDLVTRNR